MMYQVMMLFGALLFFASGLWPIALIFVLLAGCAD